MKQKLLLLISLCALWGCSKTPDTPSPIPVEPSKKLSGSTAYISPVKNGIADTTAKFLWDSKEYDENGLLKKRLNRAGVTDELIFDLINSTYEYNKSNELVKMVSKFETSNYGYWYELIYENGLEMARYQKNEIRDYSVIENSYNSERQLTRSTVYVFDVWEGKSLVYFDSLVYNNGLKVRQVSYFGKNRNSGYKLDYEYDSRKNLTKEVYTDLVTNETNVRTSSSYKYDNKNRIIEYTVDSYYDKSRYKYITNYDASDSIKLKEVYRGAAYSNDITKVFEISYSYHYK